MRTPYCTKKIYQIKVTFVCVWYFSHFIVLLLKTIRFSLSVEKSKLEAWSPKDSVSVTEIMELKMKSGLFRYINASVTIDDSELGDKIIQNYKFLPFLRRRFDVHYNSFNKSRHII